MAAMSTEPVKADRLRDARVYLGFSRDDVSGAMGRERRWVDDIENGRQQVTGEELRKLSRLYRRPVGWLCGETTFQPDPEMLRKLHENPRLTEGDREAVLDFAEFLQGAGPAPVPPAEQARRAAWRRSLRTGGGDE
jgi:transcriptional regulator with XRE-family HTH domain